MKKVIYIIPFVIFIAAYLAAYFFVQRMAIAVPQLVGQDLPTALALAADKGLSVALLREQDEAAAPAGTVLAQTPLPGRTMRYQRPILVTIARSPAAVRAFNAVGLPLSEIEELCKKNGLRLKAFYLPSGYAPERCYAQFPTKDQEIKDNTLTVYIAASREQELLMADLRGLTVAQAISLVREARLSCVLVNHQTREQLAENAVGVVVEQVPLPGAVVLAGQQEPIELVVQ